MPCSVTVHVCPGQHLWYTGAMTLAAENAQLRAENAELRQLVDQLQQQLLAAQQRIAELEQPPTDPPPFVKPNRAKAGQAHHPRKKRATAHNQGRRRMTPTRQV